jgi:hypothetical protein
METSRAFAELVMAAEHHPELLDGNENEAFAEAIALLKGPIPKRRRHAIQVIMMIGSRLQFINNPLMLKMLVELQLAGKLSQPRLNRFTIFAAMLELKRDILAEDKGAVANRDSNVDSNVSLWRVHQVRDQKPRHDHNLTSSKFTDLRAAAHLQWRPVRGLSQRRLPRHGLGRGVRAKIRQPRRPAAVPAVAEGEEKVVAGGHFAVWLPHRRRLGHRP